MTSLIISEKIDVNIRWLLVKDLNEISNIEDENWPGQYTVFDFKKLKKQDNVVGTVAYINTNVVGFLFAECYSKHIKIVHMSVSNILRRKSIGKQLINHAKNIFLQKDKTKIIAEVDEYNLNAHLFLKACNFEATHVLDNYNGKNDAYVFEYNKEKYKGDTVNKKVIVEKNKKKL